MNAKSRRGLSSLLIWFLATKTVYAAPAPTQFAGVPERTQYPPVIQGARESPPETEGFYPTRLEREGHELQLQTAQPTATETQGGTFTLLHNLLGTLEQPEQLLDWILNPDTPADAPAEPSAAPVPEVTSVTSSSTATASPTISTTTSSSASSTDSSPVTNNIVDSSSTSSTTTSSGASSTESSSATNNVVDSSSTSSTTASLTATSLATHSVVDSSFAVDPPSSSSSEPSTFQTTTVPVSSVETSSSLASTSTEASTFETTTVPVSSVETSSSLASTSTTQDTSTTEIAQATMAVNQDAFIGVGTGPIPSAIPSRDDHPVQKNGVNTSGPIETNKFHSALFIGGQTNATFTHPYALAWARGGGALGSYGMAISHTEANLIAMGPGNSKLPGSPSQFYINPIGIHSIVLSATELGQSTTLTAENFLPFSADAVLRPQPGSSNRLTVPVVQGMGFVTGVYTQLQPAVQSGVHFRQVVTVASPRAGIFKYRATLEDGAVWLIYVIPDNGQDPDMKLVSSTNLQGPSGWSGTIQVAKNPAGSAGESLFDNSSGVFAVEATVSGQVNDQTGTYRLAWGKSGKDSQSTPLMMYALPHHVAAFDDQTRGRTVNITLRTTTKGLATAVIGEYWTMNEPNLPTNIGFAPWVLASDSSPPLSSTAQATIRSVALTELEQDMDGQTDLNSMYFSGKALSKFATLIYTVHTLLGDTATAGPALERLKSAFARFVENRQQFPLVYDNVWKGVVSSGSYDGGDPGADFGNTLYNDHHFHYGYFIHAAAIIGALDPSWIADNRDWVNMLVRDSGNAASNDPFFPFSRGFDWYHGHSWAKGLFESYDGKDQESSSEDMMYAYALKMWGKTIGDASMEARGNLMLGVMRRSFKNYFLMESDNVNHPPNFIGNKVTGILFENKIDHTTYFGGNLEYIQGIHMLPLLPTSPYIRSQNFVREEWEAMFASNAAVPAETVQAGWKGVLYANLAIIDPIASWNFFAQSNFDSSWIDGGASRTWYLAFAAGLAGGSPV